MTMTMTMTMLMTMIMIMIMIIISHKAVAERPCGKYYENVKSHTKQCYLNELLILNVNLVVTRINGHL